MRLSIEETARCLDLPVKKVERWISQGRIPVRPDGRFCVFNESALEKWAATHHLSFRLPDEKPKEKMVRTRTPLAEGLLTAMKRGGVYHDIKGSDVESVLEASVAQMPGFSEASQQLLVRRLLKREQLMSTGIGKGIAMPHPRTPLDETGGDSMVATFFLREKVAFGSIDDQPVFVLFILLCPNTKKHLNLLSRLAFCVRDNAFVSFLKKAPDAETLFSEIERFEQRLDQP